MMMLTKTLADDIAKAILFAKTDPILAEVRAIFSGIVEDHGSAAIGSLNIGGTFHVDTPELRVWLKQKTIQFADVTWNAYAEDVRRVVDEGQRDGLNLQAIARKLDEDVFQGRKDNALTVARTESAGAASKGRTVAWEDAGISEHQWVSSRDASVRPEHQELEGEIVTIGEPFPGGLLFPGDTEHGDIGSVINCRCVTVAVLPGRAYTEPMLVKEWQTFAARLDSGEKLIRRVFLKGVGLQRSRAFEALGVAA